MPASSDPGRASCPPHLLQVQGYHFSHVFRQTTQKMIQEFRMACKEGSSWICEVDNYADPEALSASLSSKMQSSLSLNMHRYVGR